MRGVAVLDEAVQVGLPIREPVTGETLHVALGGGQELRQRGTGLVHAAGSGIAGRQPAAQLVGGIVGLRQGRDSLVVAPRREQRDAAADDHPLDLERIVAFGDAELLERRLGLADRDQVEAVGAARLDIVGVQGDGRASWAYASSYCGGRYG